MRRVDKFPARPSLLELIPSIVRYKSETSVRIQLLSFGARGAHGVSTESGGDLVMSGQSQLLIFMATPSLPLSVLTSIRR